jgi:hypothetical protein
MQNSDKTSANTFRNIFEFYFFKNLTRMFGYVRIAEQVEFKKWGFSGFADGATTFSITTLARTTLSAITLSAITLSMMTFSKMTLSKMTFCTTPAQLYST